MATELSEIRNEVLVQLQAGTNAGFLTDTMLNDWIDRAHKWAAGFKKWTYTEGRASTTFASLATNADGLLEGNYPEGWKSDSIRKMRIDGKNVAKREFSTFLDFLEDNTSSDKRIFADFGLVYYVNPNIDISGTVAVWGQYTPTTIDSTDDTAITVFSNNAEEGNEAIIEKVISYAKRREQKLNEALAHDQNAKNILEELWKRHTDEQFAYHTAENDGMFKRIDMVEGGFRDDIVKRDQFN